MINYYYLNVLHIKINELSIYFNDKEVEQKMPCIS